MTDLKKDSMAGLVGWEGDSSSSIVVQSDGWTDVNVVDEYCGDDWVEGEHSEADFGVGDDDYVEENDAEDWSDELEDED